MGDDSTASGPTGCRANVFGGGRGCLGRFWRNSFISNDPGLSLAEKGRFLTAPDRGLVG